MKLRQFQREKQSNLSAADLDHKKYLKKFLEMKRNDAM